MCGPSPIDMGRCDLPSISMLNPSPIICRGGCNNAIVVTAPGASSTVWVAMTLSVNLSLGRPSVTVWGFDDERLATV